MFCTVLLILAPAASVVSLWNVLQHVRCDSSKTSSSQLHVVLAALTEAPLTFGVDGTSIQTLISVGKVTTFVKKYFQFFTFCNTCCNSLHSNVLHQGNLCQT